MTDVTEHEFSKSHIMHNFFFSSLSTFLNISYTFADLSLHRSRARTRKYR